MTRFGFTLGAAGGVELVVGLLGVEVVDGLVVLEELVDDVAALDDEVAAAVLVEVLVEVLAAVLSDDPEQPVRATALAATKAAAAPQRGVRASLFIAPP
ncbi:hypothetical protein [Calidifontibacter terrae]